MPSSDTEIYTFLAVGAIVVAFTLFMFFANKPAKKSEGYERLRDLRQDHSFNVSLEDFRMPTTYFGKVHNITDESEERVIAYPRSNCRRGRSPGYPYSLYVDWPKVY